MTDGERSSRSDQNGTLAMSTGSVDNKTAVLGLGNIGGGVARNLARADVDVVGFDLDADKMQRVVEVGGTAADSAASAVTDADVVFTSLPGPKHLTAIADDILPAMKSGALWVELSTNDLDTARLLAGRCADADVRIIDAPVSGGPEGAEAGTLSIFVGGADADVAEALPLLEIAGGKVDHLGDHGTGIAAKIAQVTLCYTQTVTLIESLLLGVKAGIEPAKMLDLIQNSAGTSYCATAYGPEILAGTYDESFPISHAAKDMRLAMALANSVGADLPYMEGVAELYEQTESVYGPTAAHLLAAQLIEQANDTVLHQL